MRAWSFADVGVVCLMRTGGAMSLNTSLTYAGAVATAWPRAALFSLTAWNTS